MKIGLISDTHGDADAVKAAFSFFNDVDIIMHSGDLFYHGLFNNINSNYNPIELSRFFSELKKPLIFSKGNCDSEVDQVGVDFNILDPVRLFYHEKHLVYLHHGDKKNDKDLIELSKKFKFNIVVSGHTHVCRIEKKEGILFINPGSPSLPKGGNPPTIGIIDFNEGNVMIIDLENKEIFLKEEFYS